MAQRTRGTPVSTSELMSRLCHASSSTAHYALLQQGDDGTWYVETGTGNCSGMGPTLDAALLDALSSKERR